MTVRSNMRVLESEPIEEILLASLEVLARMGVEVRHKRGRSMCWPGLVLQRAPASTCPQTSFSAA